MYSNPNTVVVMTTGMKEKVCHCPEVNVVKNCEYQNLCSRFKTTLGLPGKFDMSAWQSMCFLSPLTNFLIISQNCWSLHRALPTSLSQLCVIL